jgi:serine/threonine protein phosphatase PrpC
MTTLPGNARPTIEGRKRMSWKMAHVCVRGSAHVRFGLPNQDAVQCVVIDGEGLSTPVAVAAVSDGHGGARHFRSQVGSSLAVHAAAQVLPAFFFSWAAANAGHSIDAARVQAVQREIVDRWLAAVLSDLENHPLTEEELNQLQADDCPASRKAVETMPALAYGATLLVAAATEDSILLLQLGDGEILCVCSDGQTTRPLPADGRLAGNQTTSLCQPDAWRQFRSAWFSDPDLPALILLSTDGYVNSFRSDQDFLQIGSDYFSMIQEQGIETLAGELPGILIEASQQGSGDDITLVILESELRRSAGEAFRPRTKPRISLESRTSSPITLPASESSE